jgi:hypothetical protein
MEFTRFGLALVERTRRYERSTFLTSKLGPMSALAEGNHSAASLSSISIENSYGEIMILPPKTQRL